MPRTRKGCAAYAKRSASAVVVALVVVTLVVVALVVVTLEELGGDVGRGDLVEVDRLPRRVDDRGALEHRGQRLAAGDLGDHRGDLTLLVDRLGELVGVHAVLLGGHDEVL